MKNYPEKILSFLVSLYCMSYCGITNSSALAQIVPDSTLPQNSIVTPNGNIFTIIGGSTAGINLFHSFRDFSLPTGRTAFFNNATNIQNILTRITGNSVSNIDGLLKANGAANLFLINPNGIIFGTNARLDIGGSFIASTASSINFNDGFQFSAVNSQPLMLLTVSIPLGLQMGVNPQAIAVRGNGEGIRTTSDLIDTTTGLRVRPEQTLALVGGDVAIAGGILKTAGGNIELSSLGSFGQVRLNFTNRGLALDYDRPTTFQDIKFSDKASVDASGLGSGNIQVRARNIFLTGESQIESSTLGDKPNGTLLIKASENVEAIGKVLNANGDISGGILAEIKSSATGKGGNLIVEAANLSLQSAKISTDIKGDGIGNSLTIKTSQSIEASNSLISSTIKPRKESLGEALSIFKPKIAGEINIETAKLSLQRSQISADVQGSGNGGSITVKASESINLSGSSLDGKGPAGLVLSVGRNGDGEGGNLFLETAKLSLQNGAAISTATDGNGNAGSITIRASESLEVSGINSDGRKLPSAVVARVESRASGKGGSLTIETNRLLVDRGASISVSDNSDNSDNADVKNKGAGDISITANSIFLNNGGSLNAETRVGERGNINLNTSNLQLQNNSKIQANAYGSAIGGNITIDTKILAALQNSDITANAQQASGGKVIINAQSILGTEFRPNLTSKSDITASSELGAAFSGVVQINITDVDPSKGVNRVSVQTVDSSKLIAQRCQADLTQSKFTIVGRGGLPPSPIEVLTTNNNHEIIGASEPVASSPQAYNPKPEWKTEIIEASSWAIAPNGKVTLIANHPDLTLGNSNSDNLKSCPR